MIENTSIVQMIQLMLAPGIMISACGLLLLGMNNKYSLVVNRIRLLNEERRKISKNTNDKEFNYHENIRLESLSLQISALDIRVRLVRNAVLSYTVAVAFFVLTSLFIGLQYTSSIQNVNHLITFLFLAGMVLVLAGVIFAAYETIRGYEIVHLDVRIDE
ncbi:MAG: DUF2721 domain-containing protein [Ignavibacteriaceae bacterium]